METEKLIKQINQSYTNGIRDEKQLILKVIDERIKFLTELIEDSKLVKNGELKDIFEACIHELEELKARIER